MKIMMIIFFFNSLLFSVDSNIENNLENNNSIENNEYLKVQLKTEIYEEKNKKYHLNLADEYYIEEEYLKAYLEYEIYANKYKSSSTSLKLGIMAYNGIGIKKNIKLSDIWFQKSIKWNPLNEQENDLNKKIYENMSPLDTRDSTQTLQQLTLGFLSLKAYDTNYYLVSYMQDIPNGDPINSDKLSNFETKFQISVRADIKLNFENYSYIFSGAYTQVSTWQQFNESSPFRDINYKPELFLTFPTYHEAKSKYLKGITLGFKHSSNGQNERTLSNGVINYKTSLSRSWNRTYLKAYFQVGNFIIKPNIWYRIPDESDDNPDIVDYYGYGDVEIYFIKNKLLTKTKFRYNPVTKYGSAEVSMSYPIKGTESLYLYAEAFTGYGYTLIDYNKKTNEIGFGISLSR